MLSRASGSIEYRWVLKQGLDSVKSRIREAGVGAEARARSC